MNYFLYRHIRLDKGTPFYIGIGSKRKSYNTHKQEYERAFATYERNPFWKHITNKTEHEIEILYESDSSQEIMNKEREFISLYGKACDGSGILCNITDGGESFPDFSPEVRYRVNTWLKQTYEERFGIERANQIKAKISASGIGRKIPPRSAETIKKMSDAQKGKLGAFKGKKHSSGSIKKISDRMKGNIPWNKGVKNCFSDETRKKMSEGVKKSYTKEKCEVVKNMRSVPIVQLSLSDEFIKEWPSIKVAQQELGRNTIAHCLIGYTRTACGFKWIYKKDYKPMDSSEIIN